MIALPILPHAAAVFFALLAATTGLLAQPARIVEWVENAPASDCSRIALGYPVPIPVDTPLPFTGFRTYSGLHMRHQDLAATTSWVHAFEIGETRNGRTFWAYQLGDGDMLTIDGLPEQAMFTNAGIHAREWQSPEVSTGIIELLATGDDHPLVPFLRDNANIIVIPVLNVDGFLQTQRTPASNWLGSDPDSPDYSPRDGRMRRKNMLAVDEVLGTGQDHLKGIDLNRNNEPFWNSSTRSSSNNDSLVHHGQGPQSEPETRALDAAAALGPAAQLSMYTDIHSFSKVHFWVRSPNLRLLRITENLLRTFSTHHQSFPAGKNYTFANGFNLPVNVGIGSTDEYFTYTYQVPAWTLEIEPGNSGGGTDYGGLGRNGHDGFILPESEVPRVRTQLAESFAMAYYKQAGPPALRAFRIIDKATKAVVVDAQWDTFSATERQLHLFQAQAIQLGRSYRFWTAFDKPMRMREGGEIFELPGLPDSQRIIDTEVTVDGSSLRVTTANAQWHNEPGDAPDGYLAYPDDAFGTDLRFKMASSNIDLVGETNTGILNLSAYDITGQAVDADPATPARWADGGWSGYEDSDGVDLRDNGGVDSTIGFTMTGQDLGDPFTIEAGSAGVWRDPIQGSGGFKIEILSARRALMYWFTFDDDGNQDWYLAVGKISGNQITFAELISVSGGAFGQQVPPEQVTETVVGSATFTWSGCEHGVMSWRLQRPGLPARQGRANLERLTRVMGVDCGVPSLAPIREEALYSGSWTDATHPGEGFTVELMSDGRVLVYWFGLDPQGNRRWFFGTGEIRNGKFEFDEMLTASGGRFGSETKPETFEVFPWGALTLDLACDGGQADYSSTEPGFQAGQQHLIQLTHVPGLNC